MAVDDEQLLLHYEHPPLGLRNRDLGCALVVVDSLHEILSHFAAYRDLYEHHAFYVPEGIDKIAGVILCALAVRVLRRGSWDAGPDHRRLATPPLPAAALP